MTDEERARAVESVRSALAILRALPIEGLPPPDTPARDCLPATVTIGDIAHLHAALAAKERETVERCARASQRLVMKMDTETDGCFIRGKMVDASRTLAAAIRALTEER